MVCVGFYLRNILLQPCHNTDTFKVYNLLLCMRIRMRIGYALMDLS